MKVYSYWYFGGIWLQRCSSVVNWACVWSKAKVGRVPGGLGRYLVMSSVEFP